MAVAIGQRMGAVFWGLRTIVSVSWQGWVLPSEQFAFVKISRLSSRLVYKAVILPSTDRENTLPLEPLKLWRWPMLVLSSRLSTFTMAVFSFPRWDSSSNLLLLIIIESIRFWSGRALPTFTFCFTSRRWVQCAGRNCPPHRSSRDKRDLFLLYVGYGWELTQVFGTQGCVFCY